MIRIRPAVLFLACAAFLGCASLPTQKEPGLIARGADPEKGKAKPFTYITEKALLSGEEAAELSPLPNPPIHLEAAEREPTKFKTGMPIVQNSMVTDSDFPEEIHFIDPPRSLWHDIVIGNYEKSPAIGVYLAGGASPSHGGGGGEAGFIGDIGRWYGRLGLAGFVSSVAEDGFIGPTLAFGMQAPTRVSPFVGVGTFLGYSEATESAEDDNIDNDNDGRVDENGETRLNIEGMFATVSPEVGIRFWITEAMQLSTYANYNFTTVGRDFDFWTIGVRFALYSR